VQRALARQVVLAVRSARLLGRLHSVASSSRRDAVARSSCRRRVEERPSAARLAPAWWQVPAAAWRQLAGVASARAMASPSERKAAAVVAEVE